MGAAGLLGGLVWNVFVSVVRLERLAANRLAADCFGAVFPWHHGMAGQGCFGAGVWRDAGQIRLRFPTAQQRGKRCWPRHLSRVTRHLFAWLGGAARICVVVASGYVQQI